ncbi:hypothetical protein [Terriglobus albidus]|uniref:hypothetical protein n=1 Tax=Terriglobus albidus TaxID=1592106 RepID=UPI0021E059B6|nr:hypothetical protein [Terriglobus albidus]
MRRLWMLTLMAAPTLGAAVAADRLAELRARMDTLQDARDDLRDALDAKDGAKTAALSSEIVRLLQQDTALWKEPGFDDVLKINQETIELAEKISTQAKSGERQHALESYLALQKSCAACHDLHPEKRLH